MLSEIVYLILGIALILVGADKFTDGACGAARRLRVSELMIGMTVVAFGTSLPEFVVSLMSSVQGSADMSVGNVVGSNLFNALVIVGASALVLPMALERATIRRDLPLGVLFSFLFLLACFCDPYIFGGDNQLSRPDGILILLLFMAFLVYSIRQSRREQSSDDTSSAEPAMPVWRMLLYIVVGIAGLVFGGNMLVDAATAIARQMGLSETIIGLTILAGGTSLPELATSIIAALKGKSSLAIGNALGSNLFNIGFVLGICSIISPMRISGITLADGLGLVGSSLLLYWVGYTGRKIQRWEGFLLLAAYVGYITCKIVG